MTRPLLGVTADLNDVYWRGLPAFAANIADWQRMGLSSVLLLSGEAARAHAMLPACDAAGFGAVVGGMAETAHFIRTDELPNTQAAADDVVAPVAALLAQHPSVEAVLVDDDGETARISRVRKIVDAYRRLLPGVPVVAANVGLDRAGPIQRAVGCDRLLLQCYPCAPGNAEGSMTLEGFGYPGLHVSDYVRTVQSEAGEPSEGPHAPLWLIAQAHDFAPVPPSGFTLRRPTAAEIRGQYQEAWRLGAERVYWFNWHSRSEPSHSWTGLEDLPELRTAIAELDGHVGVPHLPVTDYQRPVEDWWSEHPFNPEGSDYRHEIKIPLGAVEVDANAATYNGNLWSAIQALPQAGGVVWLGDGTYNAAEVYAGAFAGFARNHVQLRAKPGASPVFVGILRMIPVNEARDYSVWSLANSLNSMTNTGIPARQVIAQHKLRDWYVKGVTFDGQGATQNLSLSTAEDCVFDDCTFLGIVRAPSGHPGHVTGNSALDNIWFRNCRFRGIYGWSGGGLIPVLAVYLDGLHGGGAIGCVFDDGAFNERDLLGLNNDDFSRDYNLDGQIPVSEHRMAQYVVSYGNVGGARYSHMDITGRNWLVTRYTRTSGTLAWSLVRADSKSNNIDNPPLPKWQYVYTGGVVRRNLVPGMGGTGYLVRHMAQNAGPYPNTIAPLIGQYTVADNVVTSAGFNRWNVNEGPNAAGHIGPNTVSGNATSGTITPAVAWAPQPYAYLEPSAPLAAALDRIAALEAENANLWTQVAALEASLAATSAALTSALAENASLTADLAAKQSALDAATAEAASLAASITDARAHWSALTSFMGVA